MTLHLIDKDLRNKYAEALYKNELSHDKDMDAHDRRLNLELVRNSQMIDASQQIFLNRVKQKRTKWSQDDLRFRDHYKLVCRSVQNKKLQNINSVFASKRGDKRNGDRLPLPSQLQKSMTIDELSLHDASFFDAAANSLDFVDGSLNRSSTARGPNHGLPKFKFKPDEDEDDLYDLFTRTDKEFLNKFPAKIEITVTDIGRQYINAERTRQRKLEKQNNNFERVQTTALQDARYHELVTYLDEKDSLNSKRSSK
jgi:hypothetical protein